MSSNYPPGVSGNEFQISGPDREWEAPVPEGATCEECGCGHINAEDGMFYKPGLGNGFVRYETVVWQSHHIEGVWWLCPCCGQANNAEEDVDAESPFGDPDWQRDEKIDLAWEDRRG